MHSRNKKTTALPFLFIGILLFAGVGGFFLFQYIPEHHVGVCQGTLKKSGWQLVWPRQSVKVYNTGVVRSHKSYTDVINKNGIRISIDLVWEYQLKKEKVIELEQVFQGKHEETFFHLLDSCVNETIAQCDDMDLLQGVEEDNSLIRRIEKAFRSKMKERGCIKYLKENVKNKKENLELYLVKKKFPDVLYKKYERAAGCPSAIEVDKWIDICKKFFTEDEWEKLSSDDKIKYFLMVQQGELELVKKTLEKQSE